MYIKVKRQPHNSLIIAEKREHLYSNTQTQNVHKHYISMKIHEVDFKTVS